MKKRRTLEDKVVMDATPMIDVTFQLLIFFIITLKFKVLEKKLVTHLPTDFGSGAQESAADETFSEVRLSQHARPEEPLLEGETRYALDGVPLQVTGKEALAELGHRLQRLRGRIEDLKGRLKVDRGVPHARVVEVLDVMRRSGCRDIRFAGMTAVRNVEKSQQTFEQLQQESRGDH